MRPSFVCTDTPTVMDSSSTRDRFQRASQVCARCKKAKRRCDKVLPTCTLCSRLRKDCDYSDSGPALPNADEFAMLRAKVGALEAKLDRSLIHSTNGIHTPLDSESPEDTPNFQTAPVHTKPTFPAGFFLDAEIYGKDPVPRPFVNVSAEIWSLLGSANEIHDATENYFQTIHTWLPIVSRKRVSLNLANPKLEPTADLALLLLGMRMIAVTPMPSEGAVRNDLYWRVKGLASTLESNALLSVQLLQSIVLLAAYEIGNAIFPSAYLTTGHAARLGHAMGVHNRREAPQMLRRAGAWAEVEETGRTWWAVMLLDRYVSLGSYSHPLATDDPSRADVLPADDSSWDVGEMTSSEPLYVSSPTSLPASWYQRTCQATHVLGRYIRHRDDKLLEAKDRFIEAGQLLRTMHALTALLPEEAESRPEQYGTPIALCYSAVIHLCDPYACTGTNHGERTTEEVDLQTLAIAGMKQAAADVCQFSQHVRTAMFRNVDTASPLIADALYQAAAIYAWLVYETGDLANIRAYRQITDVLKAMETRWVCATEYLSLLEKAKKELYGDSPNLMTQTSH